MAKKRSCRRTVNEDKVHEKAVKIRKMTDEQLVQYVNDRAEKARSEGFNQGKKSATGMTVNDFLKEISNICSGVFFILNPFLSEMLHDFADCGISDTFDF